MSARPPSPEYFRAFILNWRGGVKDDAKIVVVPGRRDPHPIDCGATVEVGEDWLRSQAIPRKAVETP